VVLNNGGENWGSHLPNETIRTFCGSTFMLASAAKKNALDGFPITFASTPQAYCTHG